MCTASRQNYQTLARIIALILGKRNDSVSRVVDREFNEW
jgi:hypothetical protein